MFPIPWQAMAGVIHSYLPKKQVVNLLGTLVSSVVIPKIRNRKARPKKPIANPYKKFDMTKYTEEQMLEIRRSYARWQGTQKQFAVYINGMFDTNKSVSSLLRIAKG